MYRIYSIQHQEVDYIELRQLWTCSHLTILLLMTDQSVKGIERLIAAVKGIFGTR